MEAQRFDSRFLRADRVRVDWPAGEGSGAAGGNDNFRTVEAVLEDMSELGACMQLEEPIPPGTLISISAISGEAARFSGRVAYCVYRDYGYFAGIRFPDATIQSSGVLEPRYLANPALSPPTRR